MYKLIELFNQFNFARHYLPLSKMDFFTLSLYQKWPLSMIFALSKNAIMKDLSLDQKPSLSAFIKNGLFCLIALSKGAFISLY